MATDKVMGGDLLTSRYAELHSVVGRKTVRVRGSAYDEYSINYFSPDDARLLARYILELADDAERDPELDALKADLSAAITASNRKKTVAIEDVAETLYAQGYRK